MLLLLLNSNMYIVSYREYFMHETNLYDIQEVLIIAVVIANIFMKHKYMIIRIRKIEFNICNIYRHMYLRKHYCTIETYYICQNKYCSYYSLFLIIESWHFQKYHARKDQHCSYISRSDARVTMVIACCVILLADESTADVTGVDGKPLQCYKKKGVSSSNHQIYKHLS